MKAVKYLFALWTGFFVYTLLIMMFGPGGFFAYRQLQAEQAKIEANIQSLVLINHELEDSMSSLLFDRDTLALYAREQGYAQRHERFIRIVGLGLQNSARTSPGEAVLAAEPQFTDGRVLRIIAFSTVITILLCMALFDFLKHVRDN